MFTGNTTLYAKWNATEPVVRVTISPETVNVIKGNTQQFSAAAENAGNTAVTWSVSGNTSAATTISSAGLLSIASAETAPTLTVRAALTADTAKFATATVTVITGETAEAVWLVGTMTGWGESFPPGTPMTKNTDGTFTWEGIVAANSAFKFSLTNTTGWNDEWNGSWYAPEIDQKEVTLNDNENDIRRFDTD
jgi:hypothetical protein